MHGSSEAPGKQHFEGFFYCSHVLSVCSSQYQEERKFQHLFRSTQSPINKAWEANETVFPSE